MTRRCFVAAVMVCSMAASASAAFGDSIRVFSDRDRFSADVGPVAVEPFGPSSCLGQRSTTLNAATGISCFPDYRVQAGVTFQAELHDNVFFPGLIIDSSGGFEGGFIDAIRPVDVAVSPLTVTFDAPVAGFGFDTNRLMGSSFTVTIADAAFTRTLAVAPFGGIQFFGFQSASANIRRVSIAGSGAVFGPGGSFFAFAVDNFRFGGRGFALAPTPEPATLLLVVSGVCGALGRRGRREGDRA